VGRIALAVLVVLGAHASTFQAEDLTAIAGRLAAWLEGTDLNQNFRLEKLRRVNRPDAVESRWLQLDLRFVTKSTGALEEHRRFLDAIRNYRAPLDRRLIDTLFFKLVHEAGVRPSDAAVAISVLDESYLITYAAAEGKVVLEDGSNRGRPIPIDLGPAAPEPTRGTVPVVQGADDLPDRIQRFLQSYFATPPGVSVRLLPLDPAFVGATVEGLRSRVLPAMRVWERLDISIVISTIKGSRRAYLVISAQYASGLGSSRPARSAYADMEARYPAELEQFAQQLMLDLQSFLKKLP